MWCLIVRISRGNQGKAVTHSYLLEELIGLDSHERFSEEAEVMLLTEALKTSYREATNVLPPSKELARPQR